MPSTCCVGGCKSNYKKDIEINGEVCVYRFPSTTDEERDRQLWFNSLPNKVEDTDTKRICQKHWPENFESIKRKGRDVPLNPPTIFSLPPSFCRQTVKRPRNVRTRSIDSDTRRMKQEKREEDLNKERDLIKTIENLEIFCRTLSKLSVMKRDGNIQIHDMSEDIPPVLVFSVIIYENFKIECYKFGYCVPVRDILGFSAKLETYSQLMNILERMQTFEVSLIQISNIFGSNLQELIQSNDDNEITRKVLFLAEQLKLINTSATGNRYCSTPISFKTAISLYLRSRSCYAELRQTLQLPHPLTIQACFGKLGTPGTDKECRDTITKVYSTLTGKQLYTKIMVDEIHILPSIRYRGHHLVGRSVDNPDKIAKTVLGLMVETMYGGPSFMARLIPIFSLDAKLLFEQVLKLIEIIHEAGGFVFLIICDDLKANQSMYSIFRKTYGPKDIFGAKHPITNSEFPILYLLHDPTHLFKNLRNNWVTEKMQSLDFVEPYTRKVQKAEWRDLVAIYNTEMKSLIKQTRLCHAALFPTNFEKQKVKLVTDVFNEKTIAALADKTTQIMVKNVTKMWHILNVKTTSAGKRLNDEDRHPIYNVNDERLVFLVEIAECFNLMVSKYDTRVCSLTIDTRKALYLTLNGLVHMIKMLISDKNFNYILTGVFQSDPIEGLYGVFRGDSGGNMYIAYEQILSSMTLRRIKLFDKLDMPYSNDHKTKECCESPLSEKEVELLDSIPTSQLSENELSSLYYVSGYVSFKHNIGIEAPEKHFDVSEFTTNVSRGLLKHPTAELFELAMSLLAFYKNVEDSSCSNRLLKGFKIIYESTCCEYDDIDKILRRYINCFSKGYCTQKTEELRVEKRNRKKKKERMLRSNTQ